MFYFTFFATLAGLATAPLGAVDPELAWVWPTSTEWLIAAAIGLMGGSAQILMTIAYRCAPVSVVAPFDYMALVYGFILGFLFFAEIPDAYLIVGGATVVASGIYIVHRETVVARAAPPPAGTIAAAGRGVGPSLGLLPDAGGLAILIRSRRPDDASWRLNISHSRRSPIFKTPACACSMTIGSTLATGG